MASVLSTWSVTLYFFVALFYLLMKRRKDLDRPLTSKFGTPLAIFLLAYTGVIGGSIVATTWKPSLTWFAHRGRGGPLRHVRRPAHQAR